METDDLDSDTKFDDIDIEAILSRTRPLTTTCRRTFYEAPEFIKRLTKFVETDIGEDITLTCKLSGLPRPSIKWYKDEEEVTENGKFVFKRTDSAGKLELLIINVCKYDEGSYKCKAENAEGVTSTTCYLSVTVPKPKNTLSLDLQQQQQQQQRQRTPSPNRGDRAVSYPPLFPTILEKLEDEEREADELRHMPPSPALEEVKQRVHKKGCNSWPLLEKPRDNEGIIFYRKNSLKKKQDREDSLDSELSRQDTIEADVVFELGPDQHEDALANKMADLPEVRDNGENTSVEHERCSKTFISNEEATLDKVPTLIFTNKNHSENNLLHNPEPTEEINEDEAGGFRESSPEDDLHEPLPLGATLYTNLRRSLEDLSNIHDMNEALEFFWRDRWPLPPILFFIFLIPLSTFLALVFELPVEYHLLTVFVTSLFYLILL